LGSQAEGILRGRPKVVEKASVALVILGHVGELLIWRELLWLHLVALLILNALDGEILLEWLGSGGGLLLGLEVSRLEALIGSDFQAALLAGLLLVLHRVLRSLGGSW
jgi:hypothetical protein